MDEELNVQFQGLGQVTAQIERLTLDKCKAEHDLDPKFINIPGDAKKRFLLVKPDGTFEEEMPIPGWLDLRFETPNDLKKYIDDEEGGDTEKSAVFYTEAAIVFIPDINDRRDRASCALIKSSVWQILASAPPAMSQRDFIRFLRITLKGCITDGNPLLNIVKNIKFKNDGTVEGNIQHGNESLGKSINAAAMGLSEIPEEINLSVRVFDNHPFIAMIPCAVEIDPQGMTFRITPYPLVMKLAMDAALQSVADVFIEDTMPPIYRGTP